MAFVFAFSFRSFEFADARILAGAGIGNGAKAGLAPFAGRRRGRGHVLGGRAAPEPGAEPGKATGAGSRLIEAGAAAIPNFADLASGLGEIAAEGEITADPDAEREIKRDEAEQGEAHRRGARDEIDIAAARPSDNQPG